MIYFYKILFNLFYEVLIKLFYLKDTNYHAMNYFQNQNSISHLQSHFIINT